jgi:hypothetical protein
MNDAKRKLGKHGVCDSKVRHMECEGYTATSPSSFPHRMGCTNSDMFRIGVSATEVLPFVGGVTLADFHAAFLTSPLFKLELWLLSMSGYANKDTLDNVHLHAVSRGEERSFGPWSTCWETLLARRWVVPDTIQQLATGQARESVEYSSYRLGSLCIHGICLKRMRRVGCCCCCYFGRTIGSGVTRTCRVPLSNTLLIPRCRGING